ncbi:hypothetical protein F2Q69_00029975 [Brassica cretica]|uniref:Uncharacterized protein n=1 Tax=Brassica cretica TaxID=69181 RepID=A0A8S9RTQ6_BRACR|nr:hypothetical protein F2Q69_00029975 [Brassica cretica]
MPFDAIVGRPWLHQMRAVPSVYQQCVKFMSPTGEKTILGSQKQARACHMSEFRKMHRRRRISHSHATSRSKTPPKIYPVPSL